MNAYGPATISAAKATGILTATVREGKAEAATLAPVFGRVLPVASELGVSFDQVGAALAAMTRLGLNADESATSLRATLNSLLKPSQGAEKQLQALGTSSSELRKKLREEGLIEVLGDLRERFGDNEEAMTKVFPNIRALTGVLSLVGKNAEQTRNIFASLANATETELNKAFATAAKTAGFKFNVALAQLQVLLIRLGDEVLPVVIPALNAAVNVTRKVTEAFAGLEPRTQRLIIAAAGLAAVIGPAIFALGLFVTAGGAVIGAMASMASGVASAMIAIKGSVLLAGTVLTSVPAAVATAWGAMVAVLAPVFTTIAGGLALLTGPIVLLGALMVTAAALWITKWQEIKDGSFTIWNALVSLITETIGVRATAVVKSFLRTVGVVFNKIAELIRPVIGSIADKVQAAGARAAEGFAQLAADGKAKVADLAAGVQSHVGNATSGIKAFATDTRKHFDDMLAQIMSNSDRMFKGTGAVIVKTHEGMRDAVANTAPIVTKTDGFLSRLGNRFKDFSSKIDKGVDKMAQKMIDLGDATASGIGEMSAELVKGKMSMNDFVNEAVKALAKLAFQAAGAAIGGPFGAFFGSFGGGLFAGGFAEGGFIPRGQFGIVGERGPELAFAGAGSTITPLDGLGGGGMTIEQHFNVTGLDFSDKNTIRRVMRQIGEEAKRETTVAVAMFRRGGDLAEKNSRRSF